jgi:hypothetical protein
VTFLRHSRQVIDLMDAWKVEMYAGRQKMNQDALNRVAPYKFALATVAQKSGDDQTSADPAFPARQHSKLTAG